MSSLHQTKREIAEFARLLHERGWIANHDGNVSARLPGDPRFAITPTAMSKRLAAAEGLAICNLEGKGVAGGKPPGEVALHAGAYRREDVKAVIHAHPPQASAYALARRPIAPVAMPEVVVSLGDEIPLVPLLIPKDPKTADLVAGALARADAALLAGNGAITVGVDLEQAYLRMELLEHYADILCRSAALGGPAALEPDTVAKLLEMRRQAGLGPKETVRPIVADEVRRALGGKR
jgi:L-fuculose-phosphate aldolase